MYAIQQSSVCQFHQISSSIISLDHMEGMGCIGILGGSYYDCSVVSSVWHSQLVSSAPMGTKCFLTILSESATETHKVLLSYRAHLVAPDKVSTRLTHDLSCLFRRRCSYRESDLWASRNPKHREYCRSQPLVWSVISTNNISLLDTVNWKQSHYAFFDVEMWGT